MWKHCSTLLVCSGTRGWQLKQRFTLQPHQKTTIQCKPGESALNEFGDLIRQSFLLSNKDTGKVIHDFFQCLLKITADK